MSKKSIPIPSRLYAEGQLVRRIGRFVDVLIIHLVRGYQTAQRHAAHAAA
jgi:hypothetical protein